ncbi:MAG: hypothetical protein R3E50_09750 [Halioglobus sp.]
MQVLLLSSPLLCATRVIAVEQADVAVLESECEAARQEALAPIRARRTQSCIEQELHGREYCEQYYTTYGNVSRGPGGAPTQGYFYDLPECKAWLDARQALGAGP